jgi:transposase InsO family protein
LNKRNCLQEQQWEFNTNQANGSNIAANLNVKPSIWSLKVAEDITYVPTTQGWLYVAVVLDLKSRKVIGWSMRDSLEQTLVHEAHEALEMALGQRVSTGLPNELLFLLFHSDRGSRVPLGQTRLMSIRSD